MAKWPTWWPKVGGNKGQLSLLVEAICRDFRRHDVEEPQKPAEWHKQTGCQNNRKDLHTPPGDGILRVAGGPP